MAWPSVLTTFTDPLASDKLNSPSHSSIETAQNTSLEELQTFIGVNTGATASAIGTLLYDIKAPNSNGGGHVQTANKGGTGQTAYAKGDLLVASSSSVLSKLSVGSTGQVPIADSNASAGIRWGSPADNTTFIAAGVGGGIPQGANVSITAAAQYSQVIVYSFTDGADQELSMSATVPTGFTGISSIKAIIVGDNTGGEAYLNFATTRFAIGSGSIAAGTIDGTDTASVYAIQASTSIQQLTVPTRAFDGVSTVSAGDIVAVAMKRTAANAADTHNTTLGLAGFLIKWS